MGDSMSELPQKLKKEVAKLRETYDYQEITIDREADMMFIEYITSFKKSELKLCFRFNINSIASTINISVSNISSKKKHGINSAAIDFMTGMVMDKFIEQINNMPIY